MAYEDKSFQDFQGTKISKWDRAFQLSQHSYVLSQAIWKLGLDMWSEPQYCIQYVQTLYEFWNIVSAIKKSREPDNEEIKRIEADFDKAYETALLIPSLTDSKEIISKTRSLCKFASNITFFAQGTGWGLPENKKEVTEDNLLEKGLGEN